MAEEIAIACTYLFVSTHYNILSYIPNKFIPEYISSTIVITKNNSSERKGYEANFAENYEENDLYHIIRSIEIYESEILTSYIYTDIK